MEIWIINHCYQLSWYTGIRAPRTARNKGETSEPYGAEATDFATRRYMQRDVEIEFDTTDKSGGFIGTLYLNKTENAAVQLVREGLASVHSYSADGLSWSKQLYDAEVRDTCSLPLSRRWPPTTEWSQSFEVECEIITTHPAYNAKCL